MTKRSFLLMTKYAIIVNSFLYNAEVLTICLLVKLFLSDLMLLFTCLLVQDVVFEVLCLLNLFIC